MNHILIRCEEESKLEVVESILVKGANSHER
ncbi:hypothetical protein M948_05850 [Virgibacillus sp. CM-4]|nr:hypothetical protein M948_05850 [Virgibacillus sp. CM-4]